MISRGKHTHLFVSAFVGLFVFACVPDRALAQWGMGWGWGWGGFRTVPSPQTYLNDKSLVDAARGYRGPSGTPYSGNSNAYFNRVRDNGFVERYNVDRREPSYYRPSAGALPSQGAGAAPTALTAAQQRPVLALSSFYDADNQLIWPTDAPTSGDLKEKKTTFDQASLAVLKETKGAGVATTASVTEARRKLIDYGQPALQYVRTHSSARIADTFHFFLLSLYDSLAQAAHPPAQANATTPAPGSSS